MRQLISLLFVSLAIGGAWFSGASARTWIASPDGSAGDGLLNDILVQAGEADTVRVSEGMHDWDVGLVGVSLSIQGAPGAVITGGGVGALNVAWFEFRDIEFIGVAHVAVGDLNRFSLQGCISRGSEFPVSAVRCESLLVDNCQFVDNTPIGEVYPAGLEAVVIGHLELENCLFLRNKSRVGVPGNEEYGGGALSVGDCETAIIRKNVFQENEANVGSAIFFWGATILLEENTFYRNDCQTGAATILLYGDKADGIVRQNIFANNGGYGLWISLGTVDPPRVYCNAFWENQSMYTLCNHDEGQWWSCEELWGYEGFGDFYSVIADPMFCNDENLGVSPVSDLANPPGKPCEPIGGALGIGCINPVLNTSWGSVKKLFQNGEGERARTK